MKRSYINFTLLLTIFCLLGTVGFAQNKNKDKNKSVKYEDKYKNKNKSAKYKYKYEFCGKNQGNYYSNGNRYENYKDLRETNLSAGDLRVLSKNGRITVKGENRSDILVRACVKAWAETEAEAKEVVDSIRVETSGDITADIPKKSNASVSYEILVPRTNNLDLSSNNGRITISNVDGIIKFMTKNGRITLDGISGDIKGRTNNGRVTVKLAGNTWNGNGLDVQTRNGRITLYMPSNFAADVEVGTNNGRFKSNIEELQVAVGTRRERRRGGPKKVSASINGGGAPIRLVTNNGRVSINAN